MSTSYPIIPTNTERRTIKPEGLDTAKNYDPTEAKIVPGVSAALWIFVAWIVGVLVFEMSAFG